jgi:hypothetical protein
MPRRDSSLGANPLDAILPRATPKPEGGTTAPALRPVSVSVGLRPDLLERARNAVYWTPGLTLAGVANLGLSLALEQLERVNDGKPFPPRTGSVPVGRRVQPPAPEASPSQPVW